jgi:mRNA interferase HigB
LAAGLLERGAERIRQGKRGYANANIVGADRVIFNIKGDDYRLLVANNYRHQIIFIKWIGTHATYDNIDVKTVRYED